MTPFAIATLKGQGSLDAEESHVSGPSDARADDMARLRHCDRQWLPCSEIPKGSFQYMQAGREEGALKEEAARRLHPAAKGIHERRSGRSSTYEAEGV